MAVQKSVYTVTQKSDSWPGWVRKTADMLLPGTFLGHIDCRSAYMRPIAVDVARSVVCVSVSLSVCWAHELAVQKDSIDRDAVWGTDSGWSKEP